MYLLIDSIGVLIVVLGVSMARFSNAPLHRNLKFDM